MVNKEMDKKQSNPLPEITTDMDELATMFNNFFIDKINDIRKGMASNYNESLPFGPENKCQDECILSQFEPTNVLELTEIIKESGIKCSPSDILPQSLFEENINLFIPQFVDLVNLSLSTGDVDGVKLADIIPWIKGNSLDQNLLKNYRPISNLTFLGKLIERVVLKRLDAHLTKNNLHINEQSAYKQNNSTETLLVRITNDILVASDKKTATVVMILDLSAAFDTVDHDLLLNILSNEIGLRGTVLKWFKSFLTGRSQRIRLGQTISSEFTIMFGVPQGSVLGPVLFNIYIRSIYYTVKKCGFNIFGYADDHQVYKSFYPTSQKSVLSQDLKDCFQVIQKWMMKYFLQLNTTKTQIIVFGLPNVLKQITIGGCNLSIGNCIRFVSIVKNLGFIMDSNLNMRRQIMKTKKTCFHTIRNICKIRFLLNTDQLKLIVNSLVVSCIDYCNALYIGLNDSDVKHLQLIQNSAAKAIFGKYKYDHIEDDLKSLHWLDIRKRIVFKVSLLIFKILNGTSPKYLQELISYAHNGHTVSLDVPRMNTNYGGRAFSHIGPKIWNKLPQSVTQNYDISVFKSMLKTFLFNLSTYDMELLTKG